MTTAVPSVEDVTNAFPTAVTKITGEPNYASLKNLKDELKANAASIPTTLGGGTHGYLGLILSPAAYATIAATQFIEPIYPGQHPNIPAGTSAANTSTIVRRHTEDLRQWREFKNVNTAEQLLCIAYTLVFKTGLYFEDCKTWNTRPANQHTWDNFKIHFQTAQHLLRDQIRTTKQAGFHSNFAQHTHPPITQPPAEYQEALINLASSAAADRELLTKLATSVAAINQHINKLNHQPTQPPPLVQTDNDTTTTSTALSSVTTSLNELQQQLNELKKENASLRNNRPRRPRSWRDNGNYCWTHGYRVGNKHNSETCQNKAPGHQDRATPDNTMGGSQANKPEHS